MNRKEFIRRCGATCLHVTGLSVLLESCTASNQTVATINNKGQLKVPLSSFILSSKNNQLQYKRYVVVSNEKLNFPIVIYRSMDAAFTALLLRCSHQFNELNVNGELLTCSAHGSEFNAKGEVVQGPAEDKLRSFITTVDTQNVYIHLL